MLEAAAEFRVDDKKEKAIPLHAAHHDQVNAALGKFKEQVTNDALASEVVDHKPSPNERRAVVYLDAFLGQPFLSEEEKALIQAAKVALRRARFQNLQREINKLQKSVKTVQVAASVQADKLINILRQYPLLEQSDRPAAMVNPRFLDTPPDIILSESFDQPTG